MVSKNFFHPGNILRQVNFRGIILGNDHLYSMSVFNGPQLFEFFYPKGMGEREK